MDPGGALLVRYAAVDVDNDWKSSIEHILTLVEDIFLASFLAVVLVFIFSGDISPRWSHHSLAIDAHLHVLLLLLMLELRNALCRQDTLCSRSMVTWHCDRDTDLLQVLLFWMVFFRSCFFKVLFTFLKCGTCESCLPEIWRDLCAGFHLTLCLIMHSI